MAGGLLQLITSAKGISKQFIGNPKKTFFNVKYQSYTNFGIQKSRLDYQGIKNMSENNNSYFKFKIDRLGDLLTDMFIVISLPDIWSSLYKYSDANGNDKYKEYKFKWIENIGTEIIKELTINIGSQEIIKYSGSYLTCCSFKSLDVAKKEMFDEMIGNVPEINDPESLFNNNYPTAMYSNIDGETIAEPSIRGRKLYIPIQSWFTTAKLALPMIALQNIETVINITLRPINDLFTIEDQNGIRRRITPVENEQMFNFIQPPLSLHDTYTNKTNTWNFDLHIIANYIFLDMEERKVFAQNQHKYIIKQIYESEHPSVGGSKKINLNSNGLVSNLMFYMQRNDVKVRNEWSNYTNWDYSKSPQTLVKRNDNGKYYRNDIEYQDPFPLNIDNNCCFTGLRNNKFNKDILQNMAIIVDGKYRENNFDKGVYSFVEKYNRNNSIYKPGLYYYYYSLVDENVQPTGFMDATFFKDFEFETETVALIIDSSKNNVEPICATVTNSDGQEVNTVVGYSKSNIENDIFLYNYNLHVFEERLNILNISAGDAYLEIKT